MTDYHRSSAIDDDKVRAPAILQDDAGTILRNRVSWGAIFAGAVLALTIQTLLTMLGIGIGVATIDPGTGDNPAASTFSIAAGLWYAVAGIIAAFAGGYTAARLSGRPVPSTGAWHGLTTWALTTLVVLYLLTTTVGGIVGGVFSGVAGAIGGLGRTVAEAAGPALAQGDPLEAIESQIRAIGDDPEALNAAAANAIRALVTGDEAQAEEARRQAAEALAAARNIPVEEAAQQVAQLEQQYRQQVERARQTATEAAQAAAGVVSTGALTAFIALVLGGIAAWFGGRAGVVRPDYAEASTVATARRPA